MRCTAAPVSSVNVPVIPPGSAFDAVVAGEESLEVLDVFARFADLHRLPRW
jgi:hypothetical protein